MDGGIIAIIVLVVIQIVLFAYGYGRLTQKVKDACDRIARLEKMQNSMLKE